MRLKQLFLAGLVILLAIAFAAPPISQPAIAQERPDAPLFAQRGPYTVGTRELIIEDEDRPLELTIWYPATNPDNVPLAATYRYRAFATEGRAIRDAAPDLANGPFPLVVFSHGSGGLRLQSLFYTEHLASYGFVVIAADHPGNTVFDRGGGTVEEFVTIFALRPLDILRQITFMETLNQTAGDFQGLLDMETIIMSGHSFGGYTTWAVSGAGLDFSALDAACQDVNEENERICDVHRFKSQIATLQGLESTPDGIFPAPADPRIKLIIPLAPSTPELFSQNSLAAVTVPTMIIVGSNDQVTTAPENAYRPYELVGSQTKALVVLENADHYIFVEQCTDAAIALGFFASCSDPVWDMARAHDLIKHFATAFILATLYGDPQAQEALANADFAGMRFEYQTK